MKEKTAKLMEQLSRLPEAKMDIALAVIESMMSIEEKQSKALLMDHYEMMSQMAYLTKSTLGAYARAVLVDSKNGKFVVDPEDYVVGYELREKGEYGSAEINYISEFLTPRSKLLMVGAHIGTLLVPLSKLCSHAVAIEANPHTYDLLLTNLALNEIHNCTCYNIAASEKQEVITFLASKVNSGGSKRKPLYDDYMYSYDKPEEIKVDAYALDDYLDSHNFDVVVMDLEGSEYFALKGMDKILQKTQVLIMEFIPHHFRNISGIHMDDLLTLLKPFDFITIPSKGVKGTADHFEQLLKHLYDNDMSEDGIIFEKLSFVADVGVL